MLDQLEELPLFPLNAVLLPHARMPIHIFEPRYLDLIRNCLRNETGFGICLIKSGSEVGGTADPHLIGTACRILSVQTHADKTMDIMVEGRRRFRIRKIDEDSQPYLVGHVEPVSEEESNETNRLLALSVRVRELTQNLIEQALQHANMQVASITLPEDPTALSFVVAEFLNLEPQIQQRFIEFTDTTERLAELIPILEDHLANQEEPLYTKLSVEELSEWINLN
ncbi:MAG: LON peptidase substrate-binding domain-containing protein [Fimbriimonadaceae bacterium]